MIVSRTHPRYRFEGDPREFELKLSLYEATLVSHALRRLSGVALAEQALIAQMRGALQAALTDSPQREQEVV